MNTLPTELVDFIKRNGQFDYDPDDCECGQVTLNSFEELKNGKVWLDASTKPEEAYLELPAISLLKSCEAYDPEYILMWLPNEKVFGSWDIDHWKIIIFPKIEWKDILSNPTKYLNAQWYDYEENISKDWYPPHGYVPIKGWPF